MNKQIKTKILLCLKDTKKKIVPSALIIFAHWATEPYSDNNVAENYISVTTEKKSE